MTSPNKPTRTTRIGGPNRLRLLATGTAVASLLAGLGACDPSGSPSRVGTFTPHSVNGGAITYSAQQIVTELNALGVKFERVQQVVGQPLGGEFTRFQRAGVSLQVTAKANAGTISHPLDTPEQQQAFVQGLGSLLDEYHTPLLAIENEETADNFYDGTPDQYLTELRLATQVAKAHGVPITDGGIQWPIITLVTWNHLRTTKGTTVAAQYLRTVAREPSMAWTVQDLAGVSNTDPDPYGHVRPSKAKVVQAWKDAEYLLAHFGSDPGDVPIDYVNFHWYVPDQIDGYDTTGYTDQQALRDTVSTIKDLTGKQVVTNELGQHGLTPAAVTGTLQVLVDEVHAPFVLWFDADGIPARALHDAPGVLRPNGDAFAAAT